MADAKIFVGGLSWETTQESLKAYFETFGEVKNATLKTDSNTGKPRGFGFVTFTDASSVSQVMNAPEHMLDNTKIDPKPAKSKELQGGHTLKVFVGGISPETTEEEIRAHFGQYGAIEEVDLPFDKVKQQRRPFCFIKFQSEDIANSVLANGKQFLGGKEVDVKKATPKGPQKGNGFGGNGGFGGHGGQNGAQHSNGDAYGALQPYADYSQQYGAGYGYGYGNGYGYYTGYEQGNGYGQSYGQYPGDASYAGAGWGQQQQSHGYHPYQR